uniref:subtilisin n=1 Tax=Oxyrrhis marina TaxID=2969 RepID=A0A7S4LNF2_OXYMA
MRIQLLAALAAPMLAQDLFLSTRVEMEPVEAQVPAGWIRAGRTPRGDMIELHFAVKQQNTQQLEQVLLAVSSPSSPDYGKHLSNHQVHELLKPAPQHLAAVENWLSAAGVTAERATPNGDIIVAKVTVEQAEALLSAEYVRLEHGSGAVTDRTPDGYSLPQEVADALDFVSPTKHFPGISQPILQAPGRNASNVNNVPKTLRQAYNVGDAVGKASKNKQAVTAFLKQYYSEDALKSYWSQYCDGITCGKGSPKLVGDATTGTPGVESMLDIEAITGVAGNVDSEFWGFGGASPDNPGNEPFMKWLTQVSSTGDEDIPRLFSTSYGEDESSWSYAAAARLNTEFMKAGARGISLLYASGDSGANCKSGKFTPNMPASSPYVTAVGGTQPASGYPAPGSESAIGLSSGGFSNYWPMPDWQKTAVEGYLKQSGIPAPEKYAVNTTGRAFPDIAAQATDFCVTPFGCGVAGTSCASPTVAGIIGLLNDVRLQNGKPTLGFLNPMLYENAGALNDITTGSSNGCGLFSKGWPAKTGWDAVTGLGTPDYAKLAKVVASLP